MPTQAEPGFRADAEKLLSGEVHLLLVVGEIACRYAVPYTTALDWVIDYIEDEFGAKVITHGLRGGFR